MAYSIRYGADAVKQTIQEIVRKPGHTWVWLALTVCCIAVFFFISGEGSVMGSLTPSDPAIASALGVFQESIREGRA